MGGLNLTALRCLGPPQNIGERAGGGGRDGEVAGGVEGGGRQ